MKDGGYAPGTISGYYNLLAAISKYAVDEGYIGRTPCRRIELPSMQASDKRFLTEDEVERLALAVPERYRVAVFVAAYAGLRWEEVAGLRRKCVDLRPGKARS